MQPDTNNQGSTSTASVSTSQPPVQNPIITPANSNQPNTSVPAKPKRKKLIIIIAVSILIVLAIATTIYFLVILPRSATNNTQDVAQVSTVTDESGKTTNVPTETNIKAPVDEPKTSGVNLDQPQQVLDEIAKMLGKKASDLQRTSTSLVTSTSTTIVEVWSVKEGNNTYQFEVTTTIENGKSSFRVVRK